MNGDRECTFCGHNNCSGRANATTSEGGEDSSGGDSDMDAGDDQTGSTGVEEKKKPVREKPEVVVDEDGFTTVPTKKRGKRSSGCLRICVTLGRGELVQSESIIGV